jgi:hypothetical protein
LSSPTNLVLHSEDLTNAVWQLAFTPVRTATTVEDDDAAQWEAIFQSVPGPASHTYTWSLWVLKDAVPPSTRFPLIRAQNTWPDRYDVTLDTQSGATEEATVNMTDTSHTVTDEGTYWRIDITFTTTDATGILLYIFPAIGANADLVTQDASAVGTVTIQKQILVPGTTPAVQYQKNTDQQAVVDWSINGNDLELGSTSSADTNDPNHQSTWSRNLFVPSSTEDLTDAAWLTTGATVDDATHVTFNAAGDEVRQNLATVDGVTYTLSFDARRVTGNYDLQFLHDSSETGTRTPVTITDTLARYSVSVLGKVGGGTVAFGLEDINVAGFGQVEITNWQVEIAAATTYTAPNARREIVYDFDGTDNYADLASFTLSGDWTFFALFRPDDNTARGLWRNGTTTPDISIDASSKVEYDAGGTVTATAAIVLGQWNLIAITLSGTTVAHYLNGAANGSGTSASGNAFSALRVGYDGATYFDGNFALMSAYARALSAEEIKSVYNNIKKFWNYDRQNGRGLTIP